MSGTNLTSVFWHHLVWNPQKVLAFGGECNPIVIGPNSDILGRIRIVFYPIHWQHSDTVRLRLGKLLFTKALSCSQFHHPFQQLIMKLKVLLNATSNSKSARPESNVWRWIHEPIPFNGEKELPFGATWVLRPIRWVPKKVVRSFIQNYHNSLNHGALATP